MTQWREWRGGACPTNEQAEVMVKWACGFVSRHSYKAHQLRWTHKGDPFDIAAYQVVGLPEELAA